MIVSYLNNLEIPDSWFDTKTPKEIEDYLEAWCRDRNNWPKDESVSVSPYIDSDIFFGCKWTENDWRKYYSNI